MMGYIKGEGGELKLFISNMKDAINEWVDPDYTPLSLAKGKMLAVDIFSEVGATVLFDFGGKYIGKLSNGKN